jgi:hypothetical protein
VSDEEWLQFLDALEHYGRELDRRGSDRNLLAHAVIRQEVLVKQGPISSSGFLGLRADPPHPATSGSAAPPDRACFFLDLLLGKADREIMRGDLEEEFTTKILPKYGARRARFWFWKQTVKTIATRNAVCRWVLVYGLTRFGEWILRLVSG